MYAYEVATARSTQRIISAKPIASFKCANIKKRFVPEFFDFIIWSAFVLNLRHMIMELGMEYFRVLVLNTISFAHLYSQPLKCRVEKKIHNLQLDGDMNLHNFKISYTNAYIAMKIGLIGLIIYLSCCFWIQKKDLINRNHSKNEKKHHPLYYEIWVGFIW